MHARALLTSTRQGATDYLDADLHDPDTILKQAPQTLDFAQPIALILFGILGHVTDDDQARSIVGRLLAPMPSGSYLALYDGTDTDPAGVEAQENYKRSGAVAYTLRSPERIARFFDGLELVEPGVVPVSQWRPDSSGELAPLVHAYGGVARKP
ncbi:MAG TPA: SAM-dependent methyltransferase [Actinomycetes bacterium]|nr:SAM-dependent methyltransferase [Actinomycetes bacterium]